MISLREDGACKIVPMTQGPTYCAGNESAEKKTLQGRVRNLAFGLCGDLYDGKTACRKSAQQCIRASPRPAALPQKEAVLHNGTGREPQGNSLFNLISPPTKAKDHVIPWNVSPCTFNVDEHLYWDYSAKNEMSGEQEQELTYHKGTLVGRQKPTHICPSNPSANMSANTVFWCGQGGRQKSTCNDPSSHGANM